MGLFKLGQPLFFYVIIGYNFKEALELKELPKSVFLYYYQVQSTDALSSLGDN